MNDVVAFDLRAAAGSPTGVGRHMLSIVLALAQHRPDLRLRAYTRDEVQGLPASVAVVRIRSRGPLWHLRTWWDLRRRPAGAWCSTSLIIPALSRGPALPVVLDVISFLYPQYHTRRTKLAERLFMPRAIARHPIITGSETTRRDVEALFGPCRAVTVHPWVAPPARPVHDPGLPERLGITQPYVLCLGTVEPRKNVVTAIRAISELRRRGREVELVVVGAPGWADEATRAELDAARREGSVAWTGYLPDAERDALFASAGCLVAPSVYEGFGLPLLEAMSAGLAVVCSTAPAFREVAGDAGRFVDPLDVVGWADAVESVLFDPGEAERLSRLGRERAKAFSAARTAEQFGRALDQLG